MSAIDWATIPEIVWELFDEILWLDPANAGKTPQCSDRGTAQMIAWGWNPPLLKKYSETALTTYGLAAFCWRKDRMKEKEQSQQKAKGGRPKKGTVSTEALLVDLYLKRPETKEYGSTQLAVILDRARSTIQDCKAFKIQEGLRRLAKADKEIAKAKRRR
jgi:hypothetical protein